MIRALLDGVQRVLNAPALVAGLYLATLAAVIPMGVALHESINTHLGNSLVADRVAAAVDTAWWDEFTERSTGIEQTFVPQIIGFAAVLSNLSTMVDSEPPRGAIATLVVVYVLIWAFLVGGVIDRLARQRPLRGAGFFSACGHHVFRIARLGVVVAFVYWLLFDVVHRWLFDDLIGLLTRDLTVERNAFLLRMVLYAVFMVLVIGVNLLFDYTKIRVVVEDRRSVLGALLGAWRFVRRRPGATVGLYLVNGALFVAVLGAYAVVAPGVGSAGIDMWTGFLTGQAYIAARVFTKLLFYASETAYFQSQLAHAAYVAAPEPRWPDSPAVEAIGR